MTLPLITIAIPTFNRPKQLSRVIDSLKPQICDQYRVIILDNLSDIPVASYVDVRGYPITIIRNAVNIGANANIMRAFEICDTDWVWIIADDDIVAADALATVLEEVTQYSEAAVINFSAESKFSPNRESAHVAYDLYSFLEKIESFSHLLWLPTNVVHISMLRDIVRIANIYSYSYAMHLVMVMTAARRGLPIVSTSRKAMIHCEPAGEERWNFLAIMTGMTTLLDLPMEVRERKLLAKHLENLVPQGQELMQMLYCERGNLANLRYAFVVRWSRLLAASHSPGKMAIFVCIYVSTFLRPIFRPLVGSFYRLTRGKAYQPSSVAQFHRV